MTLHTFNLLPYKRQLAFVFDMATFLATRYEKESAVNLYHVPSSIDKGLFVELYYDTCANEIVRLRAFTSMASLSDYTPYVQLPDLE
jgi:hypothetical protein